MPALPGVTRTRTPPSLAAAGPRQMTRTATCPRQAPGVTGYEAPRSEAPIGALPGGASGTGVAATDSLATDPPIDPPATHRPPPVDAE